MNVSKKTPASNIAEISLSDRAKDFFNLGTIKRIFRLGNEFCNAAAPFIKHQTPLNAIQAGFGICKIIVDDLEVWPDDYFDENWTVPYTNEFNAIILKALANKPCKIIRTSEESTVIHIVQLDDVKFGYTYNTRTENVGSILTEVQNLQRAKEVLKRELWALMKNDNVILRHIKDKAKENVVVLETDDAFNPMPSLRASEYSKYLKKCIDADVSRSVMLYGPPGTGKSTMARTIIDHLGMKSFRIRVEDIGSIDTSTVFEAINVFEPEAIILDDFDRSSEQAALLETLEFFQRHVKLVIATVNNKNRLDGAILRPGRFDELVPVRQMDEDVIKKILGKEHIEHYETVKDWPIAFINEYVKRLRFMTQQEAAESIKELASRVEKITRYDDEDDNQSFPGLKSSAFPDIKSVGANNDYWMGRKIKRKKRQCNL